MCETRPAFHTNIRLLNFTTPEKPEVLAPTVQEDFTSKTNSEVKNLATGDHMPAALVLVSVGLGYRVFFAAIV